MIARPFVGRGMKKQHLLPSYHFFLVCQTLFSYFLKTSQLLRYAPTTREKDIPHFNESKPFQEGLPKHIAHFVLAKERPHQVQGFPLIPPWFPEDGAELVTSFIVMSMVGVFNIETSHINNLLEALAMRLNPLTNTFFLPTGEVTLTLEELARILGLRLTIIPLHPLIGNDDHALAGRRFLGVWFPSRVEWVDLEALVGTQAKALPSSGKTGPSVSIPLAASFWQNRKISIVLDTLMGIYRGLYNRVARGSRFMQGGFYFSRARITTVEERGLAYKDDEAKPLPIDSFIRSLMNYHNSNATSRGWRMQSSRSHPLATPIWFWLAPVFARVLSPSGDAAGHKIWWPSMKARLSTVAADLGIVTINTQHNAYWDIPIGYGVSIASVDAQVNNGDA
ncbi:hypothetical protein AMTR_s00032p00200480 [Amborella trichopoda]|uniref:Aminotransferase-like plant mobile domain-containing protein n=1 Tax=Amborella trichopoda TaxID=13333 RepID=U5CP47_AMBTC|nr:hypothetical protein AMTR_s00032p00200480 [Amborella trichopoda]